MRLLGASPAELLWALAVGRLIGRQGGRGPGWLIGANLGASAALIWWVHRRGRLTSPGR